MLQRSKVTVDSGRLVVGKSFALPFFQHLDIELSKGYVPKLLQKLFDKDQGYIVPKRSAFNRIIGDNNLELQFASFLEGCEDIVSYVKNYFAIHFKIDYKNTDGSI